MMNADNMAVLVNVIGAVESGGQVYGKRRYDAYAGPYTNSRLEHTITLGWAQNYGSEAEKLVMMIYKKDPAAFKQIDSKGSIAEMLKKDWVSMKWTPTASQKKTLIELIDSEAGHACQDELFASHMTVFIAECEQLYTRHVPAVMMYCEIRHLGGAAAAKRIFDRLGGKYDLDSIMASLVKDQRDTGNNNQVGDTKFWSRHLKCKEFIETYAIEEVDEDGSDVEEAIRKVIQIAMAEEGYLEKNSASQLDVKDVGGTGNYTKYWMDIYPAYQGQPWCAAFISWVFMKAFGLDMAKKLLMHWPFVYCPTLAAKTANKIPAAGSIVLFFRSGQYAHTGLVINVTDSAIETVEGNTGGGTGIIPNGGAVCRKRYAISSLSGMTKYFMPDYGQVKMEDETMMYYVRSSWLDAGSQTYKGSDINKAKAAAQKNKQLYVFNQHAKIIYPAHTTAKARIERAVLWANAVTRDKRHGYDNTENGRWGQHGDYACSTFVITAYEQAGVPVKSKGAAVTANMLPAFLAAGFEDVTDKVNFQTCAGMVRGDVLIAPGKHTEIYIGSKRLIGARGNATGDGPENGRYGDQTGGEIVKSGYYNYPWTLCLRYAGPKKDTKVQAGSFKKISNANLLVREIQNKTGETFGVTKAGEWYVVRSKSMSRADAVILQAKLKKAGFDAVLL